MSRQPDGSLRVSVRARAKEGEANAAVVAVVAKYYRVPRSAVRLVSGLRGRHKTLEVPDSSTGPGGHLPIIG